LLPVAKDQSYRVQGANFQFEILVTSLYFI
jgi:hypothetical protein